MAVPGGTFVAQANVYLDYNYCSSLIQYPTKLKMVLDPDMFYIAPFNSTPAPSNTIAAATGDTIVWNIISSSSNTFYWSSVGVKTTAIIGNPFTLKSIIIPHTDFNLSDDIYNLTFIYGGPYDPNNKESQHPNMLSNGNLVVPVSTNEMVYTINFQNLGNAPAKNIYIRDTLSSQFNLSNFKILNSSYPATSQINSTTEGIDVRIPFYYASSR